MGKKNKNNFEEQVQEQINKIVKNESMQIELEEVSEEKLMTMEDIVTQEEYLNEVPEEPTIKPMSEVIEEPCSCGDDCLCEKQKPIEIIEAPKSKKLTVEKQRHFLRTGRLPN